jgi:hypothetical protein
MPIDVFVSFGRNLTVEQEDFVNGVEQYLQNNELHNRAVGRTDFSSGQPLECIEQLMQQCSGTVIIALERTHIQNGIERRGTNVENTLSNVNLPTVWNQIEAGMAYVIGHPLLVIVEKGLRSEGLLETGYDWYVQWVEINSSTLHTREFSGVFADWKKRVADYHQNKASGLSAKRIAVDPEKLTVSQIIGALKPKQLWAIIGAVVAAITAISVTAYKLGGITSNSDAKKTSCIPSLVTASSKIGRTNPLHPTV